MGLGKGLCIYLSGHKGPHDVCSLGPHAYLHSTLTSPVWMPDFPDNEAKVMVASNSSHIIRD